jgi:hypothetical protein
LVAKEIAKIIKSERTMARGVYGNQPKKLNKRARIHKPKR